jgi:hypothetical protein
MKDFCVRFVPDPKPKLEHYQKTLPIFDHFKVEAHIDANLGKKAWLKSGGYLIIDQSEALTAIDVNTGRYVGKQNLEETVLKTNLEAVKEVVAQLRFRNIGGLIIIDLIDMETAENREKVYRALQDALRSDKSKTNILKISELGLVEMTRKRTRENLVQQLCEPCSYCEGRGYVLSAESVAYKLLREIRKDLPRFCGRRIAVSVSPQVGEVLLGRARKAVASLGEELGRAIEIHAKTGLHQEQFEVTALGEGPPVKIELRWLEDRSEEKAEPEAEEEEKPEAKVEGEAVEKPEAKAKGEAAKKPEPKAKDEAVEKPEAKAEPEAELAPQETKLPAEAETAAEAQMPTAPEPVPDPVPVPVVASEAPEPVSELEPSPKGALGVEREPGQEAVDALPKNPILPARTSEET